MIFLVYRQRLNENSAIKLAQLYSKTPASYYTDQTKNEENENSTRELHVGIIVAHPDDEAMFMAPTICALREAHLTELEASTKIPRVKLHILCLSNGNADGLGAVRAQELRECLRHFGIGKEDAEFYLAQGRNASDFASWPQDSRAILIDNEEEFRDGMKEYWDVDRVVRYTAAFVYRYQLGMLFTFDKHGISGHANHRAVHDGVKRFIYTTDSCVAYGLETVNVISKYAGTMDALLLGSLRKDESTQYLSFVTPSGYTFESMRAMMHHKSYFVWFRKLFVFFSRYAYYNTWKRIEDEVRPKQD